MKLRTLLYAAVSTISVISCNAGITDSDFKRAPFGDIPANKQIVTNVEDVVTKISKDKRGLDDFSAPDLSHWRISYSVPSGDGSYVSGSFVLNRVDPSGSDEINRWEGVVNSSDTYSLSQTSSNWVFTCPTVTFNAKILDSRTSSLSFMDRRRGSYSLERDQTSLVLKSDLPGTDHLALKSDLPYDINFVRLPDSAFPITYSGYTIPSKEGVRFVYLASYNAYNAVDLVNLGQYGSTDSGFATFDGTTGAYVSCDAPIENLRFGGSSTTTLMLPTIVADRSISILDIAKPTAITLPDKVGSKSRDFYLKMTVTGSQSVSFSPSTGITYTGLGNPAKTYEEGAYLLHFTETDYNIFNVVNELAATGSYNDLLDKPMIPASVTVAAPSTNAVAGTAADAKATGTALYTGFTEWECVPATYNGKTLHVENEFGEWKLYADDQFLDPPTDGPNDATNLTFSVHGVTATRHLVTPTKTSQLENDSGFIAWPGLDCYAVNPLKPWYNDYDSRQFTYDPSTQKWIWTEQSGLTKEELTCYGNTWGFVSYYRDGDWDEWHENLRDSARGGENATKLVFELLGATFSRTVLDPDKLALESSLANKKDKQSPVTSPSASGNAISFIDSITQNDNGVVTPTKKTIPVVAPSTSGVGGNDGLMSAVDKEKLNGIGALLDGKFDKTGGSITGNVTIVNGILKFDNDYPSVIDADAEGLWLSSTPFGYDGFTPRSQSFLFTRGKGSATTSSSRRRVVLVQEDLDAVTNNYKFYAGEWKFTGNADYPSLVFTNNQWELTIGQGRFRRTITAPGNADDQNLLFSDNGSLISAEFGVDKFKDRTVNEVYHKSGTDLSISFPDQAIGYSRDFYMFLRSQQGVQAISFVGSNGEVIKWSGKEPPSVFTGTTNIVRFTEVSPSCFLYQDCLVDSTPELTPVYGENGNTLIGYTLGDQTDKVLVTTNDHIVIGPNNTTISARPNVLGSDIQMGSKAWYYSAIVFSTNVVGKPATIYLTDDVTKRNTGVTTTNTSFQSGYAVGDVISLVNKAKYDNGCKVTAVNGNVITVDTIPFTSIVSGQTDYDDYIVTSTNKPAFGVVSLGDYSFAMGSGHRVYRRLDTVFGRDNAAIGDYALIGGRQNVGAYASFAAGRDNIAIGQYSTAVGNHTEALADRAHAEGYYTRASGVASHTEGAGTAADLLTASGDYSHAEGSRTKATGTTSHAEGNLSQAQFASTHAEGEQTKASSSYSHAEGYRTEAGNGTANGGWCSHAEGNSTKSTGQNSHAEGLTTRAIGQNSHAEGNYTIASGKSSHAEGSGVSSRYLEAKGQYAHAEGACTYAKGDASHAEGYLGVAYGVNSHFEGGARDLVKTYKVFWAGSGSSYTSSVNHDLIVNDVIEINGEYRKVTSVANAKTFSVDSAFPGTVSNSTVSVRQGTSVGADSHTEGRYSTSIGIASHAEGFTTRVSGDYAHAEGQRTYVDARGAHVEGVGATDSEALNLYGAKAIASHVEGIRCLSESGAQGGHAEGMGTVIRNHSEHAQGRYNVSHMSASTFGHAGNTLHSIGFGYSANARSNVVEVMQNGKVFVCGVGGYNGTNPTDSDVKDLATVVVESSYPCLRQFDWNKYPDPGADTLTYDGYMDTADGYGIFLNFGITGYSSWFFPDAFETTNIATTVANNIVGNLGDPNKITDGPNTIKADGTVIQPTYTFSAWNITVTPNDEYTPSLSSDDIHWINTEVELESRTPFSGTGWYLFDGSSSIIIGTDFNITNSVLTNYGGGTYTVVCSRTASVSEIITNKVALVSDLPTAYMPMTPDGIVRTQNGFYSFGMNKGGDDHTNTVVVIDGGHYGGATLIINGAEGEEENGIEIRGANAGYPRGDILVNGVSVLDNIDKKQDALPYPTNAIPYSVISGLTVVAPSTNAVTGSVADAKATGTALYTGFTEWECTPSELYGKKLHVVHGNGKWLLYADNQFLDPPETADDYVTNLTFSVYDVTATRHLVTPTKTSQLVNDSGFLTQHQDITTKVSTNALAGKTYDFSTNVGLYTAVRDIVQALGGTVTNFPAINQ